MNWGTKIILGMIAFMLFIIGMVVYMFKVHGNDSLVDDDYYEKGIHYDQEYKATQQALAEGMEPEVKITPAQLIIKLKDSAIYELRLLRASSAKDDILEKGQSLGENHLIIIDRHRMDRGLWQMELKWKSHQKEYFYKKSLTL